MVGFQRKIRNIVKRMSTSHTHTSSKNQAATTSGSSQGLATLIVMIVVLTIIVMFCCFAAPGIRDLCRKYVFRSCIMDDPDRDNVGTPAESTTPTIILLPYGRMLVVDRAVFAQLQADHTGIDFMELSAELIRARRYQTGSTPSILDSETTSKGLSPTSFGFSPPTYKEIFGDKYLDLPPSYSEVNLMFRTCNMGMIEEPESIELCAMYEHNEHISEDNFSDTDINNENNLNKEFDDQKTGDENSVRITIVECDPSMSQDFSNTNDCSVKESSI